MSLWLKLLSLCTGCPQSLYEKVQPYCYLLSLWFTNPQNYFSNTLENRCSFLSSNFRPLTILGSYIICSLDMGNFFAHIFPGTVFFFLGWWYFYNALRSYYRQGLSICMDTDILKALIQKTIILLHNILLPYQFSCQVICRQLTHTVHLWGFLEIVMNC